MNACRRLWALAALLAALLLPAAIASAEVVHPYEGHFTGSDAPGGPLARVWGVSVDSQSGDVFLAESRLNGGPSTVYRFGPSGAYAGLEFNGSEAPAGSFGGINALNSRRGALAVEASSGDVWASDVLHGGLLDRFDENGQFLCQISGKTPSTPEEEAAECDGATGSLTPDGGLTPTGVALDESAGQVYVADGAHNVVDVFSTEGEYLRQIADPHVANPAALAIDESSERLYVLDKGAGVAVFDSSTGAYQSTIDPAGKPTALALAPSGNLYLFDPEGFRGEGQIAEYEPSGTPVTRFGAAQGLSTIGALAVDAFGGRIYAVSVAPEAGAYVYGPPTTVPDVETGEASEIEDAAATVSGHVDPDSADGGGQVTACRFEYGTTTAYGHTVPCAPATPYPFGQDVTAQLAGLQPATEYHYRLVAENGSAVPSYGPDRVLVTFGPPAIDSEHALGENRTARFEAQIDPFGHPTTCQVEYVSEADFQAGEWAQAQTVPCSPEAIGTGFGDREASASASGLSPGTTYRYRFVAGNESQARVLGAGGSFATFGIGSFSIEALDESGEPVTRAGAHPYELVTSIAMTANAYEEETNAEEERNATPEISNALPKDILTELPPGLVGAPTAAPKCPLRTEQEERCPGDTQVGLIGVQLMGNRYTQYKPLYNLVPPQGVAARFGTEINGSVSAYITASVRPDQGYTVEAGSTNIPSFEIKSVTVRLWGVPAEPSHDSLRVCGESGKESGCASTAPLKPFLTMPSACSGSLKAQARADSYQEPGEFSEASAEMPPITGCNRAEFGPRIEARPTTNLADSPSGLHVDVHLPQPSPPEEGGTGEFHCSAGTWTGAPTHLTYRWLRNGTPISGATEPTYTETGADAGSVLQCEVQAENGAAGPGFAASRPILVAPIPSVRPPAPQLNFPVQLKGSISASGGALTCNRGQWNNEGNGPPGFDYRWLEDGAPIPDASGETYDVGAGEAPFAIQCEVIATRSGDTTVAFSEVLESEPRLEPPLPSPTHAPRAVLPEADLPAPSPADLRDAVVKLPPGLTVNPASAAGLEGCSLEQLGVSTPPGVAPIRPTNAPAQCPEASKLGTVEIDTPLLEEPLPGAVYLATPYKNPFDSLLAIYIAVDDPVSGVVVKLAGHVEVGANGQLTTTFDENPQLPFEDFKLDFFEGPRAPLKTPAVCGGYTTTSTLTPWSAPESGPPAEPGSSFQVSSEPGGSTCPSSASQQPNSPSFEAGTESPLAGAFSPFVLHLKREDGSQQFSSITVTPPPGLLGRLAGIPYCPDSALAAAEAKSGADEQASPSCPAASEVGTVTVGAGAGPSPYYVQGRAYLAGPYKGAPLSLAIVTPAVAGPYDLGTVVVRSALSVDPYTTQITVTSDPIPTELKGIPLDVRSIAVRMDRPDFTSNPTSCEAMAVGGSETSVLGQTASLANRFQVGGCGGLGFAPKLTFRMKGGTGRTGHPSLTAWLKMPEGGANIARAQVSLPGTELLDQGNLNKVCRQAEIASASCPKRSIYGWAKAWSPLLEKPLEGPVFLGVGYGYKLPALVAELDGQIRVLLKGRVDTAKDHGIRNTFELVPDAPVSRFMLHLKGGKKYGLIENSKSLCERTRRAAARFVGQNGKVVVTHPKVVAGCGKAAKAKRKTKKKTKAHTGHHRTEGKRKRRR